MDVGRDVEMSGELNLKTGLVIYVKAFDNLFSDHKDSVTHLPANPSLEAAFSFSKKLSNLGKQL